MIKKIICDFYHLLLFVFFVFFTSCKTTNNTFAYRNVDSVEIDVKKDIYTFDQKEEMPILAWIGVQEHTVERYRELKEVGINHNFSSFINIEELSNAMRAARRAKIKMIIHIYDLDNELEKMAKRFKNHSALAGYFIGDEPNRNSFSHLAELTRRVQEIDKKHFCYINLYPNYAYLEQLGTTTYREYVQLFLKEVPVEILSFDYYPIRVNDSGERFLNKIWYENLEIISDEARKAVKPFWAFALTTAHGPYPIPTLADLRLQIFSNLAYGAQGIQYFTYWTPPFETEELGYNNGPIDNNKHEKTTTWYTVQQMNKEIKNLSNVFLGAHVIKVEHITINSSGKNGDIPKGTTRFDFSNKPAEAFIIKKFDIPNNTNAVVSFLKNGNKCYMVVINRNLYGGENVTFTIEGDADLQLVKKDGTIVPAASESSSQTITPGDALIYGWDIK